MIALLSVRIKVTPSAMLGPEIVQTGKKGKCPRKTGA
jgi:hypothetical protein